MQVATRKDKVDVDLRRQVFVVAQGRKPKEVAKEPHEAFIRNTLKDKMGWPRREPAPESIKAAARAMAEQLKQRDRDVAAKKHAIVASLEATTAGV